MTTVTTAEIAQFLDAPYTGENRTVRDFDSLADAGGQELSFCIYDDPKLVGETDASVVITLPLIPESADTSLIHVDDPRLSFKLAVSEFFAEAPTETEIHPAAVVEDGAEIGDSCTIGANVYIAANVTLGDRCRILPGASIGNEGFAFEPTDDGRLYNHVHKGDVRIGDDVFVGANAVIDRASFETTEIGAGTKIHNLAHVAHNVEIAEDVWICQSVSLAGGVSVGARTRIHPHVSVATNVEIGGDAEIGTNSTVLEDVDRSATVVGNPATPVE